MDAQKTGAFIAAIRKEKGLTQAELAEMLFVSDKTVSKWERGAGFPDVKNWEPLAAALDISLVELMQAERKTETVMNVAKVENLLTDALQLQSTTGTIRKAVSYGIAGLFAVISCFLLFLLMQNGAIVLHSVFSLLFGLIAWFIPIWKLLRRDYHHPGLSVLASMTAALLSLITQFLQISSNVAEGDWAAIEDTIRALVMVVILFCCVTILLNSILLILKKNRTSTSCRDGL